MNERKVLAFRPALEALTSRSEFGLAALVFTFAVILGLHADTFLTPGNLFNLSRAFSWIAVAAFGEALVFIAGGIDLSVGAVMALAGMVSALALSSGMNVVVAVGAGIAAAALVGLVNGYAVSVVKLPPLIVTLATMSVVRGLVFGLARGWPLRDLPESYRLLGQSDLTVGGWPIPMPVLIMLGLALLVTALLRATVLGRYIYILGRSESALFVSGVDVEQIRKVVYILSGVLAGIGGILMTARLGVAAPTAATGYELDIIAATIIGGVSLFGGQGHVVGVILGAALMQLLRSGVVLLDFPVYWQQAAMGALVLVAIIWDRRHHARTEEA